jgi:hypothetical protein
VAQAGGCFSSHYHRARVLRAAARFAEAEAEFRACLAYKARSLGTFEPWNPPF